MRGLRWPRRRCGAVMTIQKVRRYDISAHDCDPYVTETPKGEWVLFEDYAVLFDELAKAWNEGNKQRHMATVGEAALTFYANPAVYAPHPHGPAFDRRDISYKAKNALAEMNGEDR